MQKHEHTVLRALLSISFITAAIIVTGCTDKPSDLIDALLESDVIIADTTITATASATFKQVVPMDSRPFPFVLQRNLLGQAFGDTAYTLIQFLSIPRRDTISVVSASLTLRAVSWSGTPGGSFGFSVHKLDTSWNENLVTRDSMPSFDQTPWGAYSGTQQADTEMIVVNLDTALVKTWFTGTSHGIILIPDAFTSVVRGIHAFGFDSTKFQPTLQVIAVNSAGTTSDTSTFSLGQDTFVGNTPAPTLGPNLIFAQGGIVYRSRLNFDVSFIGTGSIINKADLLLQLDQTTSQFSKFTTDTVAIIHVRRHPVDSTIFEAIGSQGRRKEGSACSFDARRAVQSWVNGDNNGIVLRATDGSEYSTFDRYVFFNHLAADSLKPTIKITYTVGRK